MNRKRMILSVLVCAFVAGVVNFSHSAKMSKVKKDKSKVTCSSATKSVRKIQREIKKIKKVINKKYVIVANIQKTCLRNVACQREIASHMREINSLKREQSRLQSKLGNFIAQKNKVCDKGGNKSKGGRRVTGSRRN